MSKLNQIIAIEKHSKGTLNDEITSLYHSVQKSDLLNGITRSYTPKTEDGDKFPPETKFVQVSIDGPNGVLRGLTKSLTKLFDLTATKDFANCNAKASVRVDGEKILEDVPVTYLLFLEKQLTDMHTIVKKFPTHDPSEKWTFDPTQNTWASEPSDSFKTKKVMKNHEKSPATDKHPAQVETYNEDIVIGTWRTVKFSGAIPAERLAQLLERIEKLRDAVKFAREEANSVDAPHVAVGEVVLSYCFGK